MTWFNLSKGVGTSCPLRFLEGCLELQNLTRSEKMMLIYLFRAEEYSHEAVQHAVACSKHPTAKPNV